MSLSRPPSEVDHRAYRHGGIAIDIASVAVPMMTFVQYSAQVVALSSIKLHSVPGRSQ